MTQTATSMQITPAADKPLTPGDLARKQINNMAGEFRAALPAHIPVERFMRVVMTAVNSNPDLIGADRRSLIEAAMKAAQDGLLPDGRDGAFVMFVGKVQWMPMVAGILKKVRNSGQLLTISAHVVFDNDTFYYRLGDEEKIEHEPNLTGDRGKPKLVYAVAKTKDGGIYREVMTVAEIEKVRAVSKAKNAGPWVQWWNEMARKTAIRRLSKRLPVSSDLDDIVRRDDVLYDFDGAREAAKERPAIIRGDGVGDILNMIAFDAEPKAQEVDQAPTIETEAEAYLEKSDAAKTLPDELLDEAREISLQGKASLDYFLKALKPAERKRIDKHIEALTKAADYADASQGGSVT